MEVLYHIGPSFAWIFHCIGIGYRPYIWQVRPSWDPFFWPLTIWKSPRDSSVTREQNNYSNQVLSYCTFLSGKTDVKSLLKPYESIKTKIEMSID